MLLGFRVSIALLCAVAVALLSACNGGPPVVDTPEQTATVTIEATATSTPSPTDTLTLDPTATPTPTPTDTPTAIPTDTSTPAPTDTATPEPTDTATPEPTATSTPDPTATPTPEPTDTPTPEPTDTPTPEPTATPTPAPLTSAQIFESVSPSIVFIKTIANKGSGVLIEGGYVVTNAHVVWPYATVRVVFPDGSEFLEVPVKGLDLLADLAVLGPIDPPTGAVELVDGESLPIGSETFVIGYPKVTEEFPRPTIVRGLLSRVVEMEFVGITNLQIDAALAPGHSGSALVSDRGEVIGITGFAITDANFGVATSSGDILPRVRQLIAGEDPSQLGDRRVPLEGAALRHEIALENLWAQGSYVIDELPGSIINIDLKGDQGGELAIVNSLSSLLLYLDSGN